MTKTARKKAAPSRKIVAVRPTAKKPRVGRGVKSNTKSVSAMKATTLASNELLKAKPGTKTHTMIKLLERPKGATAEELMAAVGWQKHGVHGFLAGTVKKKLGLTLISEKKTSDEPRRYRIVKNGE